MLSLLFQTSTGKCMTSWVFFDWSGIFMNICLYVFLLLYICLHYTFLVQLNLILLICRNSQNVCVSMGICIHSYTFLWAIYLCTCWLFYVAVRYHHTGKWAIRSAGNFQAVVCVCLCVCSHSLYLHWVKYAHLFPALLSYLCFTKIIQNLCVCVYAWGRENERKLNECGTV